VRCTETQRIGRDSCRRDRKGDGSILARGGEETRSFLCSMSFGRHHDYDDLVLVTEVILALLVCGVLSSSEAEESCQDYDEDEDSDCDSDDDVESAVGGCRGDGVAVATGVATVVNRHSGAFSVVNLDSSGVADALLFAVEVQDAAAISAVTVALISWINDKDGLQSGFTSAVSLIGSSCSSESASPSGGASDGLAGAYTDVDLHVYLELVGTGRSVHGEAHFTVAVRCVNADTERRRLAIRTSVSEQLEEAVAAWSPGCDFNELDIYSGGVADFELQASQISCFDSGSTCECIGSSEV